MSQVTSTIRVRSPRFAEGEALPHPWWFDSVLLSHLTNGLNLLFPAGEQFFIRSVRRHLDQVDDPALRERVRLFSGQEAQHGKAHERGFALLEGQGFEVESFLAWYRWLGYDVIEPLAPSMLRLAVTVALEHFTATMAEDALARTFLDDAHPAMRDLLRWHAAEEIEHKAVAFEVFEAAGGTYAMRVAGLVVATLTLLMFWTAATRHLIRQDPLATRARLRAERRAMQDRGQSFDFLHRAILSYLHPRFHPDQQDNRSLADRWLRANLAAAAGAPA